jgi:hypothetical protein
MLTPYWMIQAWRSDCVEYEILDSYPGIHTVTLYRFRGVRKICVACKSGDDAKSLYDSLCKFKPSLTEKAWAGVYACSKSTLYEIY